MKSSPTSRQSQDSPQAVFVPAKTLENTLHELEVGDRYYPAGLSDQALTVPPILHAKGTVPLLEWSGAVVDGSEFPSPEGRAQARALGEGFAKTNVAVIGSADNRLGVEAVLSAVRHRGATILVTRNADQQGLKDEVIAAGGGVGRITTEHQVYSMQNDDEFARYMAAFG